MLQAERKKKKDLFLAKLKGHILCRALHRQILVLAIGNMIESKVIVLISDDQICNLCNLESIVCSISCSHMKLQI